MVQCDCFIGVDGVQAIRSLNRTGIIEQIEPDNVAFLFLRPANRFLMLHYTPFEQVVKVIITIFNQITLLIGGILFDNAHNDNHL